MTSNPSLAYPAEFYYPEFLDNRPDDPRVLPPKSLPLTASIDNGVGSTPKISTNKSTILKKKPSDKNQPPISLALDIVTDQGLPDADITQAATTDPKKSLVRDPAERNIPRLIVDDSILKQAVRTPRISTTNLDDNAEQTINTSYTNNRRVSIPNGRANGDLTHKTRSHQIPRQQTVKFVENEQPPVDDYWKKEVYIDDEGLVTIEVRFLFKKNNH